MNVFLNCHSIIRILFRNIKTILDIGSQILVYCLFTNCLFSLLIFDCKTNQLWPTEAETLKNVPKYCWMNFVLCLWITQQITNYIRWHVWYFTWNIIIDKLHTFELEIYFVPHFRHHWMYHTSRGWRVSGHPTSTGKGIKTGAGILQNTWNHKSSLLSLPN